MDEFLVCSDLCEENGLSQAAEVLRSVSAKGGKAFVVVERGWEYEDTFEGPQLTGHPRSIYLDRDEAELVANQRNIRVLRQGNIMNFCYSLEDVTIHSVEELSEKISEILGADYHFSDNRRPFAPTIPDNATEAQAQAIADLFTLKFAYVVETEFA